jgi:hypothetical protein
VTASVSSFTPLREQYRIIAKYRQTVNIIDVGNQDENPTRFAIILATKPIDFDPNPKADLMRKMPLFKANADLNCAYFPLPLVHEFGISIDAKMKASMHANNSL